MGDLTARNRMNCIETTRPPTLPRLCDVPIGSTVEIGYGRFLYLGDFDGKYALLWTSRRACEADEPWVVMWEFWGRFPVRETEMEQEHA